MKTPREILFERHGQIEARLDKARRNALAALPEAESEAANRGEILLNKRRREFGTPGLLRRIWQELIWPSRRAWAGLAAVWLALLAVNLQMKTEERPLARVRSARARVVAGSVQAQQRLLAELLQPVHPRPTEPEHMAPPPRSERPARLRPC